MLGTLALCLLLTFSRGSLLGAVVAVTFIAFAWLAREFAARRCHRNLRRCDTACCGRLGLLLVLPFTQSYSQHLVDGLLGQDRATLMRFGEYKDALNLIARYPWFGVGFAGVPDIDLYVGVSSVYLLMASEMGVIGLGAILLIVGIFFAVSWRSFQSGAELDPILLGALAAVLGALVGGIFDHYFFNLDFPHSVTMSAALRRSWHECSPPKVGLDTMEFRLPALPGTPTVTLATWFKQAGEHVSMNETLLAVYSDRIDWDIPAPAEGVLSEIIAPETSVSEGQVVAVIDAQATNAQAAVSPALVPAQLAQPPAAPRITPLAAAIASEHSLDLVALVGSGVGGQVTKGDVLAAIEGRALQAPGNFYRHDGCCGRSVERCSAFTHRTIC